MQRTLAVVTILALAAAVLYGTADFLGGVASRRASVSAVLATTVPAGAVVVVVVALLGETPWLGALLGHGLGSPTSVGGGGAVAWAAASGVCGAAGLVAFYAGFAAAPISVVAPVAALVSTVLPVGVAIADGEHLTASMVAGGLICLVAIVLVSMPAGARVRPDAGAVGRPSGLGFRAAAGCAAWATGPLRARDSACSSCASRTPASLVCSGRWRSRGRREPWSPWASRWRPGPARGGAQAAGRA